MAQPCEATWQGWEAEGCKLDGVPASNRSCLQWLPTPRGEKDEARVQALRARYGKFSSELALTFHLRRLDIGCRSAVESLGSFSLLRKVGSSFKLLPLTQLCGKAPGGFCLGRRSLPHAQRK